MFSFNYFLKEQFLINKSDNQMIRNTSGKLFLKQDINITMNPQRCGHSGCTARLENEFNKHDVAGESTIDNVKAVLLTNVSVWIGN